MNSSAQGDQAPLVAVLGGGQLGRMLGLAGAPLGISFRFLDPDPACPAHAVGEVIVGAFDDPHALDALANGAAVITFEFENVPAASLERLSRVATVAPPAGSLATAQDRVLEKSLFESAGIEVAKWAAVDAPADLDRALDLVGVPAMLKTRRLGYDGKGQRVVRSRQDAPAALARLGGAPCILEALVPFSRELSVVAVRGADGAVLTWPIGENRHRDGILHSTIAPAEIDEATVRRLHSHAASIMDRLDHRGVLAIEYFDDHGRLLANEIAPRVHNSGHWTIDGAVTSQFENHLRAILGWPLGSTEARGVAVMVNLVGAVPPLRTLLADPAFKVHLYGKAPRAGRKLGHVNAVAADEFEAARRLRDLEALIGVSRVAGVAPGA